MVMLSQEQISLCEPGLKCLQRPILPLVRLVGMLYITGPFPTISDLLQELNEPVETGGVSYKAPRDDLHPFLEAMQPFERLKNSEPDRIIVDENRQPANQFAALDSWVSQDVLTQELEKINSLLCWPCGCAQCCTGPSENMEHTFFEIPLLPEETALFDLPHIDNEKSRTASSLDDESLALDGKPFFEHPPSIYHWQKGWSVILPRDSSCPNRDPASGGCRIYKDRPDVCRKPPIFSYMLEPEESLNREYNGKILPAFIIRNKLLAVWDCPYVRQFHDEIGIYAQICGLEPIFRKNKR